MVHRLVFSSNHLTSSKPLHEGKLFGWSTSQMLKPKVASSRRHSHCDPSAARRVGTPLPSHQHRLNLMPEEKCDPPGAPPARSTLFRWAAWLRYGHRVILPFPLHQPWSGGSCLYALQDSLVWSTSDISFPQFGYVQFLKARFGTRSAIPRGKIVLKMNTAASAHTLFAICHSETCHFYFHIGGKELTSAWNYGGSRPNRAQNIIAASEVRDCQKCMGFCLTGGWA